MTLVALELTLVARDNGSFLVSDPDGSQEPPSPIPAPTNFTAVVTSETTADLSWSYSGDNPDRFELVQWIGGESAAWSPVNANIGGAERSYSVSGLPTGPTIGHRIKAHTPDGSSAWAEVWMTTAAASETAAQEGESSGISRILWLTAER